MYEQQLDNFIKLSIKEATSIQVDPMNWQDHAQKASAYAAVAKLLMEYQPKEGVTSTVVEEVKEEEAPQTKEALKAAPAPQLEEKQESVQEVVEEEMADATTTDSTSTPEEDQLMNELSSAIGYWLENEGCPTKAHLNYWTGQIIGKDVNDFGEINNYPEYTQAWIDYIRCWVYLTECWNLEDIPKVLELITEGQLTRLEDITPSNIGALVAYTSQQMEEAENNNQ